MLAERRAKPPEAAHGHHPSFIGQRLLLWLGLVAVLAGALLIHAGGTNRRTDPTIAKPKAILVVLRGTTTSSSGLGMAAFIAVIQPKGRTIGVIPVSGLIKTPDGRTLSDVAPNLTGPSGPAAQEISQDVAQALNVDLTGYLVIDAGVVEDVFQTIYATVPSWPRDLRPHAALTALGWPDGRSDEASQVRVVRDLITYVPQIQHNAQQLAVQVLAGSNTDLSPYELFLLVTYVNDGRIAPMALHKLPPSLVAKQVTH